MSDLDRELQALRQATDALVVRPDLKQRMIAMAVTSGVPLSGSPAMRLARLEETSSAAARSRLRRERKPWWAQRPTQIAAAAVGLFLAVAGSWKVRNLDRGAGGFSGSEESSQVFALGLAPTKDCYGLGPGVTHLTPDKAQFSFDYPVVAKKAIATLSFTAGSVAHGEDVDISAGAAHMGFVKRTFGDDQMAQEVALTPKYLHPNEKNLVVFDNLRNPPGHEPWVVCNVAVKVQQLPDGSDSDLREQARAEIQAADRQYQDSLLSAGNTYGAWKSYRKALLFLEAMSDPGDEYDVVKQKVRDCQRELDAQCSKLMLKGQALEKENKIPDAINQYKYGLTFFPEKDHACFQELHSRLSELE